MHPEVMVSPFSPSNRAQLDPHKREDAGIFQIFAHLGGKCLDALAHLRQEGNQGVRSPGSTLALELLGI